MPVGSEAQARAFNLGSDARLRGEPIAACPYGPVRYGGDMASHWRRGWQDADGFWGERNPSAKPLPPVGQAVAT